MNSFTESEDGKKIKEKRTTSRKFKQKEDDVTITEVSEDEQGVSSTSEAIVTQPEDKVQKRMSTEEEEIITVGQTDETILKQRKTKKISRVRKAEEEEEEIKIEKSGIRKISKLVRSKPDLEEITIPEETAEELDIESTKPLKSLILDTPVISSETIPERSATLIGDASASRERVTVSMVPHNVITSQIIISQETESPKLKSKSPDAAVAHQTLDTLEPYAVTETQVQMTTGEFKGKFKPDTQEISQKFVHQEGIQITETMVHQTTTASASHKDESKKASVTMLLHEAKSVMEPSVSHKEGSVAEQKSPTSGYVEPTVILQEGLTVTQVDQYDSETKLSKFGKPVGLKPKVEVSSNEPVIISEVLAETRPGKYFPEIIVPTEQATPLFVHKHTAVSQVMQLPEKEGEYVAGKLPSSTVAGFSITPEDSILVTEMNVHEKENILLTSKSPESIKAHEDIALTEGLVVSYVHTQDKESILGTDEVEHKQATVDINNKESIITEVVTVNETEGDFIPKEVSNKNAVTNISCLETSTISEAFVQESEGEWIKRQKPSNVFAEVSVRPIEPLSVRETNLGDMSSELRSQLKYRTDEADQVIEAMEAKEVTFIDVHEKESPLKKDEKAESFMVTPDLLSQKGLTVSVTEPIEKEDMLPKFERPESHAGKTVPSHFLQSVVVEEIVSKGSTKDFKISQLNTATADVTSQTHHELITKETVTSESTIERKELEKPLPKSVEISVLEKEGVTITEIVPEVKEGLWVKGEPAGQCKASPKISGHLIATKTETVPEHSTDILLDTRERPKTATKSQSVVESVEVTAMLVGETEGILKEAILPELKKAGIESPEELTGLIVHDITAHDKESEFKTYPTETVMPAGSITGHKLATTFETIPDQSVGDIPRLQPTSAQANVLRPSFKEVVVTETTPNESEKTLLLKPHKTEIAEMKMKEQEGVTITEIVTECKEELFKYSEPQQKTAVLDLYPQEAVIKEEVDVQDNFNKFERISPEKQKASLGHSVVQCAITEETSAGETEGVLKPKLSPAKQLADLSFVEGNTIDIIEITTVDKESPLKDRKKPKEEHAVSDIKSHRVAVKSEVLPDLNIGSVKDFKPDLSTAQIKQTTLKGVILGETVTQEHAGIFTNESQPALKVAETGFVEGLPISVSSVIVADKEELLKEKEKPVLYKAEFNIKGHGVAQKTLITSEQSVKDLFVKEPEVAKVIPDQTPFHSISLTETNPAESEGNVQIMRQPASCKVDIAVEETKGLSVTEVVTGFNAATFRSEGIPENKYATTDINELTAAEEMIIVSGDTVGEYKRMSPTKALADAKQIPFENVITSEVMVTEKESDHKPKIKYNTSTAETLYEEEHGISVSEINVQDSEKSFESISQPKVVTANPLYSGHEVAQNVEVLISQSTGKVPDFSKTEVKALPTHIPQEVYTMSQNELIECEGNLQEIAKPLSSTADLTLIENQGVIISEITLDDKEEKYSSPSKPKKKYATADVIPQVISEKSEIVTHESTTELPNKVYPTSVAKSLHSLHHSLETHLTTTGELEKPLNKFVLPESKVAELFYEGPKTGAVIDLVTAQDKEGVFTNEFKPNSFKAKTDLIPQEVALKTEVVAQSSVKDIIQEKPLMALATQEQSLQECLVQSEVALVEKETNLETSSAPNAKRACVGFEEEQGLLITEIVSSDLEKELESQSKPDYTYASTQISGHSIAEKAEVLTQSAPGNLVVKKPKSVKAHVEQRHFEGYETSEITVRESEREFSKKPITLRETAHPIFEESHGINVLQVVTGDKASSLTERELPKEVSACSNIIGQDVLQVTEVTSQFSLSNLPIPSTDTMKCIPSQIPFETIMQSEISVQEKEGIITTEKAKPKVAEPIIDESMGLIVTSTVTDDKESALLPSDKPKGQRALPNISGHDIAETSEVVLGYNVGQHKPPKLKTSVATPEHLPYEGITQTQVIIRESESILKTDKKPSKGTADVSYEDVLSLNISEVVLGDKEETYRTEGKPKDKKAFQTLTDTIEVADQFQIVSIDSTKDYNVTKPASVLAKEEQEAKHELMITEQDVQEHERDFEGQFKPETKTIDVRVQKGKKVYTTSEVLLGLKEGKLGNFESPTGKKAILEVVPQEGLETIQTFAESSLGDISEKRSKFITASCDQIPFEPIQLQELLVQEKEETFDSSMTIKKSADVSFEENKSVSVMEVSIGEGELPYISKEGPITQSASHSFTEGVSVAQQSETISQHSVAELKEIRPSAVKAVGEHILMESIESKEVLISEKEMEFSDKFKPGTKTADLVFELGKGLTITEVKVGERESKLKHAETIDKKMADVSFEEQKSITITEVSLKENEMPYLEETPKEHLAQFNLTEGTGVAQKSETITAQTAAELDIKKPVEVKAIPEHVLLESVISKEVLLNESESEFTGKFQPSTAIAGLEYELESGLTVTHIETEEKEETFISSEKAKKKRASIHFEEKAPISVTEVSLGEGETPYKISDSPLIQSASRTVTEGAGVAQKTVTLTQEAVGDVSIQKPIAEKARSEHVLLESIISKEVISSETDQPFSGKFEPKTKKAAFNIDLSSELTVTQVDTHEKAEVLSGKIQADKRVADINYEENKSIAITEVSAQEEEVLYTADELPTKQKAYPTISDSTSVVQTSETVSQHHIADLKMVQPDKLKATADHILMESIISKEVLTGEQEIEFSGHFVPETKKALVNIDFESGLTITEVESEEKEGIIGPTERSFQEQRTADVSFEEKKSILISEVAAGEITKSYVAEEGPLVQQASRTLSDAVEVAEKTFTITQQSAPELKILGPETAKATSDNILAEYVVEKQVLVSEKEGEFVGQFKPDTKKADLNYELAKGITVTEIETQERESQLTKHKVEGTSAGVKIDSNEYVTVTEIALGEGEKPYTTNQKPLEQRAQVKVSELKPVSVTEVLPDEMHESEFVIDKKPGSQSAVPSQTTFEGLETTEILAEEREDEFTGSFKPKLSSIKPSLEENISVEITEVHPEDKEGAVIVASTEKKHAKQHVIKKKVASQMEVLTESAITPFDTQIPTPTSAKQSTSIQHHVTVTTHQAGESEAHLPDSVQPQLKTIPVTVQEPDEEVRVVQLKPGFVEGKYLKCDDLLIFTFHLI